MYSRLLRIVWRVLTMLLVIICTYMTAFLLVPYLDKRLPIFPAVLIGYLFLAYLLLPLVLRFWRIVMHPNHIPQYVITGDGWPSEPVNIVITSISKSHFLSMMKKAGWYEADPMTFRTGLRELIAIIFNQPYPRAPLSNLYLFGRKQDLAFEIPHEAGLSPRSRHHVRFWELTETANILQPTHAIHVAYWSELFQKLFYHKKTIWIGAATNEPYPLDLQWRNLQITHGNDGDHATERDFVIKTLEKMHSAKHVYTVKAGEPFTMRAQNIRKNFIVDGNIKVVELKR